MNAWEVAGFIVKLASELNHLQRVILDQIEEMICWVFKPA
jgi:hypothetical protein